MMYGRPELKYALETILDNADGFAEASVTFDIFWDEDVLVVSVGDDGAGFKQAILNRFGQPFNSTRKGRDGHRGLGLYLAMSLIEDSGGKMRIENIVNGGARVVIEIPRAYI